MIKREVHLFLTALMFYTRIPCPSWVDHSTEILNRSRKYFPIIGWVMGGIAVAVLYASQFVFPISISILLSMAATMYWTGAFHEDGFTDMCDSFGGGWTKEQVLTIMKDSRIGAYGTVGILMLLGIKFLAMYEIAQLSFLLLMVVIFNAHVVSRFVASTFVETHDYVQDIDKSKVKPIASTKLTKGEFLYSSLFVITPLFFFSPPYILFAGLIFAYISKMYLGRYLNKRIGGYTGDCLGATQQISEVIFYLTVLGLWNYI